MGADVLNTYEPRISLFSSEANLDHESWSLCFYFLGNTVVIQTKL